MGCGGVRVEDPEALAPALQQGMEETDRPTIMDVVVTRDPAHMLPAIAPYKSNQVIALHRVTNRRRVQADPNLQNTCAHRLGPIQLLQNRAP
jgi:hypothetical protein